MPHISKLWKTLYQLVDNIGSSRNHRKIIKDFRFSLLLEEDNLSSHSVKESDDEHSLPLLILASIATLIKWDE